MKFGQLLEYNVINIFFKSYAEDEAERLIPEFFLLFKKGLCGAKVSGLHLSFNKGFCLCLLSIL